MSLNELNDALEAASGYAVRGILDSRNSPHLEITLSNGTFRVEVPIARHNFYGQTAEQAAQAIYEALAWTLYHQAPLEEALS